MQSILGTHKLNVLLGFLETVKDMHGVVIEVGMYNGGTFREMIRHCRSHVPDRRFTGYDTFEGLPESEGGHVKGEFTSKYDIVAMGRLLMEEFPGINLTLEKGVYPFSGLTRSPIVFAHIDVDNGMYTLAAMHEVHRWSTIGTVMVIDDYKWEKTPGVEKAVHLFLHRYKDDYSLKVINNQAVLIRTT